MLPVDARKTEAFLLCASTFSGRNGNDERARWHLANEWLTACNRHDLDLIMMYYKDAIELTSPAAAQLFGTEKQP